MKKQTKLTLNGVSGLVLPEGFELSESKTIVWVDPCRFTGQNSPIDFELDNPRRVHFLACACAMHWREALTVEAKRGAFIHDQILKWDEVAFPAKNGGAK